MNWVSKWMRLGGEVLSLDEKQRLKMFIQKASSVLWMNLSKWMKGGYG